MSDRPARLVVRADDMATSRAANQACLDAANRGIARSLEVMPCGPEFDDAVARLQDLRPEADVGVHLTLSSEWGRVKWGPLTRAPSLVAPSGHFLPGIWSASATPALQDAAWTLSDIETELRTQIELCLERIESVTHLSCHMGFQSLGADIDSLCRSLAEEYALRFDLERMGFRKIPEPANALFSDLLSELVSGDWLLVTHPAYDTKEARALCPERGLQTAIARQKVVDALCSEELRSLLDAHQVQLLPYRCA